MQSWGPPPHLTSPLPSFVQELAARYGVLKRDLGIALRGLYIINPEVRAPSYRTTNSSISSGQRCADVGYLVQAASRSSRLPIPWHGHDLIMTHNLIMTHPWPPRRASLSTSP